MRCHCSHDPVAGRTQLRLSLQFDPQDVRITDTPFGAIVALEGSTNHGTEGGPALPRKTIKVAVPLMQWPTEVSVVADQHLRLTERPVFVAPVQRPRAGIGHGSDHDVDTGAVVPAAPKKHATCRPHPDPERGQEFPEPFPPPPVVLPDANLYEDAVRSPRPFAVPVTIQQIGLVRVAVIELNPVRFDPEGRLELCTSCELAVSYSDKAPLADRTLSRRALESRLGRDIDPEALVPLPGPVVTSKAQASRFVQIARAEVLNSDIVTDYSHHWPELFLLTDYLIVTDDWTWDARSMRPVAPTPGMVAEFERLARWKSSRGVRATVVTISDIVAGVHGDFRSGARDLQEVIRRFLKDVTPKWGVSWVLLGGDVEVVPIRKVAGGAEGHIAVAANDPPAANASFWTGTFLKMHVVNPGTWWGASTMNVLVRPDTGQVIPYDAAGSSGPTAAGWYFTTNNTYSTRSMSPTNFVRVNGPASVLNATLQWLYEWNTIPTDFYYSSLDSFVVSELGFDLPFGGHFSVPYVWFPTHDWDALENGLYGQHTGNGDMDGVVMATTVSVGRAPVSYAGQAKAFVDKVLAYEGFASPFGSLDPNWPRRVVLASSNWGSRTVIPPTAGSPPGNNQYHHGTASPFSIIKLETTPADFNTELIAEISDPDRRIVPYSETAGPGGRGWHFATSATDLSVSEMIVSLSFVTIRFPVPSPWIVVFGPVAELTPARYIMDVPAQDGSMSDQEALRTQLNAELPIFNSITRLYEDNLDLTPAQAAAGPVAYLTTARLTDALNARPHIVSLSGHGNSDGCCSGSVALAGALNNGVYGFIAYADSCLTNQMDTNDAFGEALVYNPAGGAVGYVGNTRFSWIDVGDDFQRAFFHRLTTTRHLGLLNDSRVALYGTTGWNTIYDRWVVFALNLVGDPEMQVHKRPGRRLSITVADAIGRKPIVVKVVEANPPRPWPDPRPLRDVLVHVRQGDRVRSTKTDAQGEARLDLSAFDLGEIELTASSDEFVPYQLRTTITGPDWVEGTVIEVLHREGGDQTLVTLQVENARRRFVARGDRADYRLILDAVENACVSKAPIAVLVDRNEDDGTIERFRFRY
jgi:hypothetical protein